MVRLLMLGIISTWIFVSFVERPEAGVVSLTSAPLAISVGTSPTQIVVYETENPAVSAKAYGVFDIETGEMLFGKNVEEKLPIASITKLFTAATALDAGAREEVVVTESDVATLGRAGKLHAGDEYSVHELFFPLLLESSNDAATAIVRAVGKIPFAGDYWADGSGLSSENKASVASLALEVRNLYYSVPHIFDITRLRQYIGKKTSWINNSPVRDMPGYLGGKHGYTEAANRTLVALFSEVTLDDRSLAYVILGSDDVRSDTEALRTVVESSVVLR